jgi:hypothetical protein
MEHCHAQFLLDPADDFRIESQDMRQPIRQYLLIEALQDCNLAPEFRETLLPWTGPAFDIATPRPIDTKRTTEHTFAATQKVGRSSLSNGRAWIA